MKNEKRQQLSLCDIFGDWNGVGVDASLVERIKNAWKKPLSQLTNIELAALLRQRFAVEYILPLARQRLLEESDDGTERCEDELLEQVEQIDLENDL